MRVAIHMNDIEHVGDRWLPMPVASLPCDVFALNACNRLIHLGFDDIRPLSLIRIPIHNTRDRRKSITKRWTHELHRSRPDTAAADYRTRQRQSFYNFHISFNTAQVARRFQSLCDNSAMQHSVRLSIELLGEHSTQNTTPTNVITWRTVEVNSDTAKYGGSQ